MRLCETAYAKINLALHVRRRRPDGYHDLETLFAFARDGDMLRGEPADDLAFSVEGPFAAALAGSDSADNLVLRAAIALRKAFDVTRGARLVLDKRLPVASGIGGGSADAAATLRLLARMWALPIGDARIERIAAELGADVPACLASILLRGDARGDQLVRVDGAALAGMPLLLVNPGVALSTAAVFAGWNGVDRGALMDGDPLEAARKGRNDLELSARSQVPAITAVLALLAEAAGVRLARMSGSGATCFALFETMAARDHAAKAVRRARSDWWIFASELRSHRGS